MIDTMGIILADDTKIPPITDIRVPAALPIAGRYRVIDFILSNMVNSGITNIGVVTEANYSSLMDHLRLGKPWDLDRKNQGLRIIPPNMANLRGGMRGDMDMLLEIRDFLSRSHQTYVLLARGNTINNIDFHDAMHFHIDSQADVTMLYRDMAGAAEEELSRFNLFEVQADGRITDIEVRPYYPKSAFAGMDICIMEKALLESIIDEGAAKGIHDFVKDILIRKLEGLRIYGYCFDGYSDKIDSMKAYYRNCMGFLQAQVREELFCPERPIYTKTKDQPPTKYGGSAVLENAFISDGCTIEGEVRDSVLSRGVRVEKGAVVRNSIIMQDSVIESGAILDHVVFDKEVHITKGRRLIGQANYPLAIAKRTKI